MTKKGSILSRDDYIEYLEYLAKRRQGQLGEEGLIRLYFHTHGKSEREYFQGIAHRAYLDLNRTLRGISRHPVKGSLHNAAISALADFSFSMRETATPANQETFDHMHQAICSRLCNIYSAGGWPEFYVGQAQKWINMTLKYVFTLGEHRLPGFGKFFEYCHVPLDSILTKQLEKNYGVHWSEPPWSRIKDYDSYMERQIWIRDHFSLLPLDVEFKLWRNQDVSQYFVS